MPDSARQPDALGFEYRVVRSARRRTVSLEVRAAEVIVRAPTQVASHYLQQLLESRRAWVLAKLEAQRRLLETVPERCYRNGERLPYLGRELRLQLAVGPSPRVDLLGDECLQVLLSARSQRPVPEQVRQRVCDWYRQQAQALLAHKTDQLCARMGLRHSGVSVRATRSKWGHCTSRGAIQYNWQILLAPEPVVDYLVAHEVCHLRHHNHSAVYWQLVASVCPDYQAHRAWLKTRGLTLVL